MYGYSAAEALGQDAIELLVDGRDINVANNIIHRITLGESWTGKFPVKNKQGERFLAMVTNTPFYDDDGSLVGIICVSNDSQCFQDAMSPLSFSKPNARIGCGNKGVSDSQQPLQVALASKLSNLVSL